MALPTNTGSFNLPYADSPARTVYQAYSTQQTISTENILTTISSSQAFVTTKIHVCIYDPTAAAVVTVHSNDEEIARFNGATTATYFNNYGPIGLRASGADTQTVQLQISGGTCGASFYIQGYFD